MLRTAQPPSPSLPLGMTCFGFTTPASLIARTKSSRRASGQVKPHSERSAGRWPAVTPAASRRACDGAVHGARPTDSPAGSRRNGRPAAGATSVPAIPQQLEAQQLGGRRKAWSGPVSRILSPLALARSGRGSFVCRSRYRGGRATYPDARADTGESIASLFGLAPQGVCHAVDTRVRRGALLPHRFTLTSSISR